MLGVRIDDKMTGDITESHVVWDHDKRNCSESSPVLLNGLLFQCTRGGVITCIDAKTGADVWEERLDGKYLPSPICAGDRLYYANDRGEINVVRASAKYELIGTNLFEGGAEAACSAGMAVADGALFVRTKSALYKIAEK
jgi:outer membrane protein assembly factor BamB